MLYFKARVVATSIYAAAIILAIVGFFIFIHGCRKKRNAEKGADESQ
jgi:hypothetical protein